jgi:hypothetical protein
MDHGVREMKKRLLLVRLEELDDRILGALFLFDGCREIAKYVCLELPWKNNQQRKSCIPIGRYQVEPRFNQHYGPHLWVKNVPGREWILFHGGNTPEDTLGCILLGFRLADIDSDGKMDVTSSKAAMDQITQFVREEIELTVITI